MFKLQNTYEGGVILITNTSEEVKVSTNVVYNGTPFFHFWILSLIDIDDDEKHLTFWGATVKMNETVLIDDYCPNRPSPCSIIPGQRSEYKCPVPDAHDSGFACYDDKDTFTCDCLPGYNGNDCQNATTSSGSPSNCLTEYHPITGACYWYEVTPMSWRDVLTTCHDKEGTLVVVDSQETHDFLKYRNFFYRNEWIGLTDKTISGVYRWTNGMALSWELWANDKPDNMDENEHCAWYDDKKWNEQSCDKLGPFICQTKPENTFCELQTGESISPPQDVKSKQQAEFNILDRLDFALWYTESDMTSSASWVDAVATCGSRETHLLTIKSSQKNGEVGLTASCQLP